MAAEEHLNARVAKVCSAKTKLLAWAVDGGIRQEEDLLLLLVGGRDPFQVAHEDGSFRDDVREMAE